MRILNRIREKFEQEYSDAFGTPVSVLVSLRDGGDYKVQEGDRLSRSWLMFLAGYNTAKEDKCD